MTENEKLRALLAEARERLQDADVALMDAQTMLKQDAALAEPANQYMQHDVDSCCCPDCCLLRQAREERDEARAEAAYWKGEFTRLHEEHLPVAFAGAYRRGAEAMREAAAKYVEDADDGVPLKMLADDGIRALSIPEDKP